MLGFSLKRSMSASIWAADGYLCAGSLAIARQVMSARPAGISGFSWVSGCGVSWICFIATDTMLSASKGSRPLSIS